MSDLIQLRRDTAADWTSNNPVLAEGEIGLELDTGKLKWGDGATAWTGLDYVDTGGGGGGSVTPPTIVDKASNYQNASSTVVVAIPAGAQAGDLLVVFSSGSAAFSSIAGGNPSSAGWTTEKTAAGSNLQGAVAVAIATVTSASANITVTNTGSGFVAAYVVVVRGWSCIVGSAAAQNGTSAGVLGSPTVQSAARDGVLVLGMGCARTAGVTLTSNLGTTQVTRAADTSLSSGLWSAVPSAGPSALLRHVVTSTTNAALFSAAVAISGF